MKKILTAFGLTIGILILLGISQAQTNRAEFPELTGTYQVGRTNYDMIDDSREEILTSNESDSRQFAVTVFYPAIAGENSEPAPYISEPFRTTFAQESGMPAFLLDSLQPHAYADAPIADEVFPVILFSPGLGTPLLFHTGQLEELASHGYIVIGISHSYSTPSVMLSDGQTLNMSDADVVNDTVATLSSEDLENATQTILAPIWVDDMLFVLNQLDRLNTNDSLLENHLDLTRIGAFGHSFGGATALSASYLDDRILAVVNMDGDIYGEVITQGLARPTMIMLSDTSLLSEEEIEDSGVDLEALQMKQERVLSQSLPGYLVSMPGSTHGSYITDFLVLAEEQPLFSSPDLVGTLENINQARSTIHNTVLVFFNTYVNEGPAPQMPDLAFDGLEVTIFNLD
ncbi:MAG: hypothetical protein Crog4KO_35820 [Crocinitomicaceae bacterium]